MQPLQTAQKMFKWMCILQSSNDSKRLKHITFTLAIDIMGFLTFPASLAFACENAKIDFQRTLFASCNVIMSMGLIYLAFLVYLERHGIFTIFEQLSEIYNTSMAINNI